VSDFMTALVISGSIFALMILTQFGRREYTLHRVLLSVLLVAGFGYAYLRDVGSFRNQVGIFMMNHQIVESSIAPFFVLRALTTVIGRVVAVKIRISRLGRTAAVAPIAGPVGLTV
jgi:hypothetical protein